MVDRWINWYVGLDVGIRGAVFAINLDSEECCFTDTPLGDPKYLANPKGSAKKENRYDLAGMLAALEPFAGGVLSKEAIRGFAGGYPTKEAQKTFGNGLWTMAAHVNRLEVREHEPSTWKSFMLAGVGGMRAEKHIAVELARRLFPGAAEIFLTSKDGRADAALLAYYEILGEARRFELKADHKRGIINYRPVRCRLIQVPEARRVWA
jgi:hypothetical protein